MAVRHPPRLIADARAALAAADPALGRVDALVAPFEFRHRPGGFPGLLKMIVEQQVSTASAAAIWARVEAGLGEVRPERVLALGLEPLRGLGLSLPKARYALELATADLERRIELDRLTVLSDAEAVASLTALKGVGRWTAQTYLMFCEGRLDLFPAGDVALQEAMGWADGAALRPGEAEAAARAERWGPHRSVAAHLLWAWYGAVRRRELPHPRREAA